MTEDNFMCPRCHNLEIEWNFIKPPTDGFIISCYECKHHIDKEFESKQEALEAWEDLHDR